MPIEFLSLKATTLVGRNPPRSYYVPSVHDSREEEEAASTGAGRGIVEAGNEGSSLG